MIMRHVHSMKRRALTIAASLAMVLGCACVFAQDYPHTEANNGITCDTCHFIFHSEENLLVEWITQDAPQDIDDTPTNRLCRSCHNDLVAPRMETHSSLTTSTAYGDWSVECSTCHDPHLQQQIWAADSSAFIYEGISTSISATALSQAGAGWTPDAFAGMVLVPNLLNREYSYKITANTTDTLSVQGPINLDAASPGDAFAIVYGKLIRDLVPLPGGGSGVVKFYAPTGLNSFADGVGAFDGICEACHTQTYHFRRNGSGPGQNHGGKAGENCTTCHDHLNGFAPSGTCVDCHAVPKGSRRAVVGEFPSNDVHGHYGAELDPEDCLVCHSVATHMNGYVELVDPDTGSLYTFQQPTDLTASPDLSDFCSACHDADGASRLPTPFDPFGNGNAAPNVADRFKGTLQWSEWYGDFCFGEEGTQRAVNSHHDIGDGDQAFSGAKLECLNCHGAHTASASQPLADPYDTVKAWTGTDNGFCLSCHNGGNGPADPGFPPTVTGPTVALRGLDTCDYTVAPWHVDYTWTNSAHGGDSKRGWAGYSGAPGAEVACMSCHDPHGSYTPANPAGNPYMIRDFVDGTPYVDDGVRPGAQWNGPPWETFGTQKAVVIPITGVEVGMDNLCVTCHADWVQAYSWHTSCNGCLTCHGHGQTWGNYDWGPGNDDGAPCPPVKSQPKINLGLETPPLHSYFLPDDEDGK